MSGQDRSAANAPNGENGDYRAAVELASFALWLWKEGWRPWTK